MSNTTPPPPSAYDSPASPPTAGPDRFNVLAIVSLISAFVISLVAIVTGHIALRQIRRTGEKGRALALAGVILGYLFTLAWIAAIVALIVFAASRSSEIVENSDEFGLGPGSGSSAQPFATASPEPGASADPSCGALLETISGPTAELQANASQLQSDPVAAVAALESLSADLESGLGGITDPAVLAAGEQTKSSLQSMIADIQALTTDPTADSTAFFTDAQAVQTGLATLYTLCS